MGTYEENRLHENNLYRELLVSSEREEDLGEYPGYRPKYYEWQGVSPEMDIIRDDHLYEVLSGNNYLELRTYLANIRALKRLMDK